jgi:hypothetical protein
MKTALAVAVLLMACLLAIGSCADSSRFQSVGGDYGQNVINTMKSQTTQTAQSGNSNSSLWSWGNAPKGSIILNGKLATDPYYYWQSLNFTNGWLGESDVDPYTGYQTYAYLDPSTGLTRYFYLDPNTGRPVYVNREPTTDMPTYGSVSPYYDNDWWGSYTLPSGYNTNSAWS